MMRNRWLLSLAGITGALGGFVHHLWGGERHLVKSRNVRGVPNHDYRVSRPFPAEVRSLSTGPSLLIDPESVHDNTLPRMYTFQMVREKLVVDHCEISKVGFTLSESGGWGFSFDARQNRILMPDEEKEVQLPAPRMKQTSQFKRNGFLVKARGLGEPPTGTGHSNGPLAGGVLWEIDLGRIMVENGEPFSKLVTGNRPDLGRMARLTKQVEFIFTYEN